MTAATAPAVGHDLAGLGDRPIGVPEYHRMIREGVIAEGSPYELLEGWVTAKMTRGPEHDAINDNLGDLLRAVLPKGWRVRGQSAVTTRESEPEPDCAIVRGAAMDYRRRHPGPSDTALVVEVADSSLSEDRNRKLRIYARARIPFYWIVNLRDGCLEVRSDPTVGPDGEPVYASRADFREGESLPVIIEGREVGRIEVSQVLP